MSKALAKNPIGIFDSGFGGLSVLKALTESFPQESFLYFADKKHLPYGELETEEIIRHTLQAAETLSQLGVKMLIIACHTASICALDALREHVKVPIIGINEIFTKVIQKVAPRKALLLGTSRTISSEYYQSALQECEMIPCACGEFVQAVEDGIENNPLLPLLLEKHLAAHKTTPFDALLLACTHFPFLEKHFLCELTESVQCLHPTKELCNAIRSELDIHDLVGSGHQTTEFYTTGDPQHFAEKGSALIGLEMNPENVFEIIAEDEEILL